jgi:hypothetical protein
MPVRHRIEDALGRQRHEELDLLLVAGGAEPAALAGEGQQAVLLALFTPTNLLPGMRGNPLAQGEASDRVAGVFRQVAA